MKANELNKAAEEYAQDEMMSGLAERAFKAGAEWQRKDLIPLINRLCEAILFEWKDAADLARKTLTQIKAREE